MSEPVGPTHPPDAATLRWIAAMMQREHQHIKDQYHLLAAGTDRVMAHGALNTLEAMANLCEGTAAAVEEMPDPKPDLPEGVVS